jgi:hypothetical protein
VAAGQCSALKKGASPRIPAGALTHIYAMADTSVISVLSGLGGALIGATAAVTGPLLLHRRTRKQQEKQATQEARANDISRVVHIRTSTRTWTELLQDAHHELLNGNTPDITRFDEATYSARNDVSSAIDSALHLGLWIPGGGSLTHEDAEPGSDHPRPSYGYGYGGHTRWGTGASDESVPIIAALAHTTRLLRNCIKSGAPLSDTDREVLDDAFSRIASARTKLTGNLLTEIEAILNSRTTGPANPYLLAPTPPWPPRRRFSWFR